MKEFKLPDLSTEKTVLKTIRLKQVTFKRIEDISGLLSKWNGLYINIESDWYKVSNGKLSEEEINDLCIGWTALPYSCIKEYGVRFFYVL